MLTIDEVKKAVLHIRKISKNDDELAHTLEDSLYQTVLTAIMKQKCEDPKSCAREALRTKKLKFSRWCS